ncbi:RAB24, member RAS oncogene family [Planoprotostelium fungivorum]|uniref:RAB24, member RAS oncogene family n=1 Tax=Planoprotostelium fungivorum TaxID=1890364 RepID=A0A2P6MXV9_9EUKA|nr:RAB24, member RAS oncogene family [Planoprotostelium fungivorum]
MSKVDVKVVLLGKHSVGKTCLVERFLRGKFKENTVATVGAAFGAKKMDVNGREVTIGVWDTAGQDRYESMSRIYYRSAKAALVCYDLTDLQSFEKVKLWVDELQQNEEECAIYIVGTKSDGVDVGALPRRDMQEYAKQINGFMFDTSAKSGDGIEEIFQHIAEAHVNKEQAPSDKSGRINPGEGRRTKSGGCCGGSAE